MATPSYRAAGALSSATGNFTPALPAGVAQGDILLLYWCCNNADTVTVPSGYAHVPGSPSTSAGGVKLNVLWKRAGASESAPALINPTPNGGSVCCMVAIQDCRTLGNPWNQTASANSASSTTAAQVVGLTTTAANAFMVMADGWVCGGATITPGTNAALTSLTERLDVAGSVGGVWGLWLMTGVKATAGATGNTSGTASASLFGQARHSIAFIGEPTLVTLTPSTTVVLDELGSGDPVLTMSGKDASSTYSLTVDASGLFTINSSTGVVSLTATPTAGATPSITVRETYGATTNDTVVNLTIVHQRVLSRTESTSATSDSATFSPNMGTMDAGMSGLAIIAADQNPTLTTTDDGWVPMGHALNGTTVRGAVFWKAKLDGSDTLTVNSSSSQQFSAVVFCIETGDFPQIAISTANGSGTNSNPANLAFGAAHDALVIATRCGDAAVVASVPPAGYGNPQSQAGGANGASVDTAEKYVVGASSEDPGVWTSATEQWVCHTIAIWESTVTELSKADSIGVTLNAANLQATATAVDALARAIIGHSAGKRIFAFVPTTIASDDPDNDTAYISVGLVTSQSGMVLGSIGDDDEGLRVRNGAGILRFYNNSPTATTYSGIKFTQGTRFYVAIDLDNSLVWFRSGAGNWNGSGTANPDTGVGGISFVTSSSLLFPFVGGDTGDVATFDGDATSHTLTTFDTWNYVSSGGPASLTPSEVATGSPSVTSVALNQVHALVPSEVTTGSPAVSSPALVMSVALTPNGVATSSPAVDSVALAQVHTLTPTTLASASPAVDAMALGQVHALAPADASTASPAVSAVALAQVHGLTPSDVATTSPAVDALAAAQVHALAPDGLSTTSPAVDAVALGQAHVLVPDVVAGASPGVDSVALGQVHVLTPDEIATSSPAVSSPGIGQNTDILPAPDDVATSSPSIGSPALGQVHVLTPDSVATPSPAVSSPALAVSHALTPSDVATSSPAVSAVAVGQVHVLQPAPAASSSPAVSPLALTQAHVLTPNSLATASPAIDQPVLVATSGLVPDPVATSSPAITAVGLGQVHVLTPNGISTGAPAVGAVAIGQAHVLAPAAVSPGSPSIGLGDLRQHHILVPLSLVTGSPAIGTPVLWSGIAILPDKQRLDGRGDMATLEGRIGPAGGLSGQRGPGHGLVGRQGPGRGLDGRTGSGGL